MDRELRRDILLTGASGFVGSRLYPLLQSRAHVRCLTHDIRKARARFPDRDWIEGDIGDEAALRRALEGCSVAYFLVHEVGTARDYADAEARAAEAFARAAAVAGVGRIIYLGGVLAPDEAPSEHLRGRGRVGEVLRSGPVPALDAGSTSRWNVPKSSTCRDRKRFPAARSCCAPPAPSDCASRSRSACRC